MQSERQIEVAKEIFITSMPKLCRLTSVAGRFMMIFVKVLFSA